MHINMEYLRHTVVISGMLLPVRSVTSLYNSLRHVYSLKTRAALLSLQTFCLLAAVVALKALVVLPETICCSCTRLSTSLNPSAPTPSEEYLEYADTAAAAAAAAVTLLRACLPA